MNDPERRPTIASVAPTLCALCGVPMPFDGESPVLEPVLALARAALGGEPVHRCLVFAPDHGAHLDPSTGGGAHGTADPADMNLAHHWAVRPAH